MISPADESRPTVRGIAAMTAGLRDLTAGGRDADAAEPAAFLNERRALIERITAAAEQTGRPDRAREWASGGHWSAQALCTDPAQSPISFDASGYYSDAQIAEIADALAAGDTDRAQHLQDRPWTAQGTTVDTDHVAVGTEPAGFGTLHEHVAVCGRPAAPAPFVDPDQEARREQLTWWHTDDTSGDESTLDDRRDVGDGGSVLS